MEFCNGSSLAAIIEKPENFYGLQQDEFLIFLKHLSKNKIRLTTSVDCGNMICILSFKSRRHDWAEEERDCPSRYKTQ